MLKHDQLSLNNPLAHRRDRKGSLLLSTLRLSNQKTSGCHTSSQFGNLPSKAAKDATMIFLNVHGAKGASR